MGRPLNSVRQFAIKKHNWRSSVKGSTCSEPTYTKWPTVYLRGQIGQTVSHYPSIEGKHFLRVFFLLFFPVCVRGQHRSNSPTSSLCWPSSALDTGCLRRDRPQPLSPCWACGHPVQDVNISTRGDLCTLTSINSDIWSIRLIEWTSLILDVSPADKDAIDKVTAIMFACCLCIFSLWAEWKACLSHELCCAIVKSFLRPKNITVILKTSVVQHQVHFDWLVYKWFCFVL